VFNVNYKKIKKGPMVGITFTVDKQLALRANEAAQKMGKSLGQVVLDYLKQLAGNAQRDQEWARLKQSCRASGG
jgi:replicative DNA helicase